MNPIIDVTMDNRHLFLSRILEIENLSFRSPWSPKIFIEEIRNPLSRLWVLSPNGIPSGYVCFWIYDGEIQLLNIAVHPQERRNGYGFHILKEMIGVGASSGVKAIWLEARPSNLAAIKLYKKLGFTEVGRRRRYYG
ncbi:MAG: ribosomal protein S18-alanine N-acetyltransferase, partial [Pseudomonadota bacterium]